jgi:hypothetical protein
LVSPSAKYNYLNMPPRTRSKRQPKAPPSREEEEEKGEEGEEEEEQNPNTKGEPPATGETNKKFTFTKNGKEVIAQNEDGRKPRRFDHYSWAMKAWRGEEKPPKWPRDEWPARKMEALISAEWSRGLRCAGRFLWGERKCQAATNDFECGHTFKEWISGGLDFDSRFELRDTGDRGLGVFTKVDWKRYDMLGCYTGHIIPDAVAEDSATRYALEMPIGPPPKSKTSRWDRAWYCALIDAKDKGNWTRFVNHHCQSNTVYTASRVGKQLVMVVRANRNIPAGSEITANYGDIYWARMTFNCACGSAECRYQDRVPQEATNTAQQSTAANPKPKNKKADAAAQTTKKIHAKKTKPKNNKGNAAKPSGITKAKPKDSGKPRKL